MKKSKKEFDEEMEAMFKRIDEYKAAHPDDEKPPKLTPEEEAFRQRMLDFDIGSDN